MLPASRGRNAEREVIEPDRLLVETLRGRVGVLQQDHGKAAGVDHAVTLPAMLLMDVDELEAQDLLPPLRAALGITDRQVDMSDAVNGGCIHGIKDSIRPGALQSVESVPP